MTEPIKPELTPAEIGKEQREKDEKRVKERETFKKSVDDVAKVHGDLERKFAKEDDDERLKKEEERKKKK
jgi:hypothetical protein